MFSFNALCKWRKKILTGSYYSCKANNLHCFKKYLQECFYLLLLLLFCYCFIFLTIFHKTFSIIIKSATRSYNYTYLKLYSNLSLHLNTKWLHNKMIKESTYSDKKTAHHYQYWVLKKGQNKILKENRRKENPRGDTFLQKLK